MNEKKCYLFSLIRLERIEDGRESHNIVVIEGEGLGSHLLVEL